jgi:uncharacterized protein (TIGR00269 family)
MLCDRCLIRSVEKRFRRAVRKHGMIGPGERVAVAVSGGKDSVVCMHLLAEYCAQRGCELVAVSVDEGIGGYRDRSLRVARRNAERLGIEHHVFSFREAFGHSLDEILLRARERGVQLGACTYCGVLRRSLLNRAARELGASKLATAHNLDDEVQAIMLNYIRSDLARLYRLGPVYRAREGFVPRIKPLREIPEKEVALYAVLRGIEVDFGECPHRGGIHLEIREFINRLEENHPNSKYMILRMFDRIRPLLSSAVPEFRPKACRRCGEPTSTDVCKGCSLLGEIGIPPPDV